MALHVDLPKKVKFVVKYTLFIITLCFVVGCTTSPKVSIYYDGFWTKHRVYQSEQKLIESAKLKLISVPLDSLTNKAVNYLLKDYKKSPNMEKPKDIIFLMLVQLDEDNVDRKIIANSEYLYDISNDSYKVLKNFEKDYLRCFLLYRSNDLDEKTLKNHCEKYDFDNSGKP